MSYFVLWHINSYCAYDFMCINVWEKFSLTFSLEMVDTQPIHQQLQVENEMGVCLPSKQFEEYGWALSIGFEITCKLIRWRCSDWPSSPSEMESCRSPDHLVPTSHTAQPSGSSPEALQFVTQSLQGAPFGGWVVLPFYRGAFSIFYNPSWQGRAVEI